MANKSIETGPTPLDAHQQKVLAAIPKSGSVPILEVLEYAGGSQQALEASLRLIALGYTQTDAGSKLKRANPDSEPSIS